MSDQPDTTDAVSPDDTQAGGDHYLRMGLQPWQVVDTLPLEQRIGFYRGNCIKYAMRMGNKGDLIEDAEKLAHYASKLTMVLEEDGGSS